MELIITLIQQLLNFLRYVWLNVNLLKFRAIKLEEKRSRSHTDDMEEKVEKLYRLISEWDTVIILIFYRVLLLLNIKQHIRLEDGNEKLL